MSERSIQICANTRTIVLSSQKETKTLKFSNSTEPQDLEFFDSFEHIIGMLPIKSNKSTNFYLLYIKESNKTAQIENYKIKKIKKVGCLYIPFISSKFKNRKIDDICKFIENNSFYASQYKSKDNIYLELKNAEKI
ncbi:hypothetical protein GVAV_003287 [Gurleya vavrai]